MFLVWPRMSPPWVKYHCERAGFGWMFVEVGELDDDVDDCFGVVFDGGVGSGIDSGFDVF